MRKFIYTVIGLALLGLLIVSCSKKGLGEADQSNSPIVTVLDKTLYKSDIEKLTFYGMSSGDSTAVVQAFIKMWINDKLIYDKAKENVPQEKIAELVEDYKKSLIVNEYQTQLLQERLSKAVSEKDLYDFFNKNKNKFALSESIIQGLYLKIPKTSPQLENFKKWYKQGTDAAVESIEKNALQNAIGYELFFDKWVALSDVMDNIPSVPGNSEDFLKKNKELARQDSTFMYLLYIKEYKLKGTEAPYEYIKDDLRNVYNEAKREEFLKELDTDLYNKALENEQIKYYTN